MRLDFVTLVRDDEVGVPRSNLFLQTPRRFVVNYSYLQRRAGHVPERVRFLFAAALEHGESVVEVRILAELLVPHADNRERRDNQNSFDASGVVQRTGDCDGCKGFAGA